MVTILKFFVIFEQGAHIFSSFCTGQNYIDAFVKTSGLERGKKNQETKIGAVSQALQQLPLSVCRVLNLNLHDPQWKVSPWGTTVPSRSK